MSRADFVEFEEVVRSRSRRPHTKIAINPDHILSITADSATETSVKLINEPPVTLACTYQELVDKLRSCGRI